MRKTNNRPKPITITVNIQPGLVVSPAQKRAGTRFWHKLISETKEEREAKLEKLPDMLIPDTQEPTDD